MQLKEPPFVYIHLDSLFAAEQQRRESVYAKMGGNTMKALKPGSNRVYVHRRLALALLVSLVAGGANPTYGEAEDTVGVLRRIGRKFAAIAEQAYPGVAVIKTARRTLPRPPAHIRKGEF